MGKILGLILGCVFSFSGIVVAQDRILLVGLYPHTGLHNLSLDSALSVNGYVLTYINTLPKAEVFMHQLQNNDQLWLVSDYKQYMDSSYLYSIDDFLNRGGGLYLLADNEPYDADAEFVSNYLVGVHFEGNFVADKRAVSFLGSDLRSDVTELYEGFTVSAVSMPEGVKPQVIGSDGQVSVASYDNGKYRILFDGGFTRLFVKWNKTSCLYFLDAANWLKRSNGK